MYRMDIGHLRVCVCVCVCVCVLHVHTYIQCMNVCAQVRRKVYYPREFACMTHSRCQIQFDVHAYDSHMYAGVHACIAHTSTCTFRVSIDCPLMNRVTLAFPLILLLITTTMWCHT